MSGLFALVMFTDDKRSSAVVVPDDIIMGEPGNERITVQWYGRSREGKVLYRHGKSLTFRFNRMTDG